MVPSAPAEVIDVQASVNGASCVTRSHWSHHCENRRCRVTQRSRGNWSGKSAQLQGLRRPRTAVSLGVQPGDDCCWTVYTDVTRFLWWCGHTLLMIEESLK